MIFKYLIPFLSPPVPNHSSFRKEKRKSKHFCFSTKAMNIRTNQKFAFPWYEKFPETVKILRPLPPPLKITHIKDKK